MTAPTQYDGIGHSYERLKTGMALARYPERATFDALAGRPRGRRVLDLASGTGWYSRRLRAAGAVVTGVDVSSAMVAAARAAEPPGPGAVRYVRAAAQDVALEPAGFDLVTAVWLLCYAEDRAQLRAMATAARRHLGPGGTYVGVEMNPAFDWSGPPATAYGLTHTTEGVFDGGRALAVVAHVDPPVSFRATFWEAGPIVEAFRSAGFRSVELVAPVLPAEAVEDRGAAFWADFRANPTICGIRATV